MPRIIIHAGFDTDTGELFEPKEHEDNGPVLHMRSLGDGRWEVENVRTGTRTNTVKRELDDVFTELGATAADLD